MKISELIAVLEEIKEYMGDLPVVAPDSEGLNSEDVIVSAYVNSLDKQVVFIGGED